MSIEVRRGRNTQVEIRTGRRGATSLREFVDFDSKPSQVGDLIAVSEVDEDGHPLAWTTTTVATAEGIDAISAALADHVAATRDVHGIDDTDVIGEPETTYVFTQPASSAVWTIQHNLDRFPSIEIVDSAGSVVVGSVRYVDSNNVEITFIYPFMGKAYLN